MTLVVNPPSQDLAERSRLVLSLSLFHQHPDRPLPIMDQWAGWLDSQDQAYQHWQKVSEQWVALDTGWVRDNCSMLVVSNEEGKRLLTIPTPEEAQDISRRVVEVRHAEDIDKPDPLALVVRPGRCIAFEPRVVDGLVMRCLSGTAKVIVTAIPA